MFLLVAVDSLFMAFAFRSFHLPIWKIPLKTNLFFISSFIISIGLLVLALTVPFMQKVLSYQPLPFKDIILVTVFAITKLMTIEISKWLFFKRR